MKNIDYNKAKEVGIIRSDRWEAGIAHHPKSIRLYKFIAEHDLIDYNDYMDFSSGGDGDDGEHLMFLMDAFFEFLDFLES